MGAITVTVTIVTIVFYLVLGAVSLGYGITQNDIQCTDPSGLPLPKWLFGLGIGHLICGVVLIVLAIIAYTLDIPSPLLFFGVLALIYTFAYTIFGAVVFSRSDHCLTIKKEIWSLGLANIILNFVFVVADTLGIIAAFNDA